MEELLNELKILDRSTYNLYMTGYTFFDVNTHHAMFYQAFLQWCIQEAIESNQLVWTIAKEDPKSPQALAGMPYTAYLFDYDIELIQDVQGKTPTEAILRAYLGYLGGCSEENRRD